VPKNQPDTAILLFARNPEDEAQSKEWFSGKTKHNLSTAQKLFSRAQKTATASGFDVHLITSNDQKGTSFSERFHHALKDVFELGYRKVIAIGSDSPQLNSTHLRKAERLLLQKEIVVGPDNRGGIYLLALNKSAYKNLDLYSIPWQTSGVLNAIIESGFSISELERLHDLNTLSDFYRILNLNSVHIQLRIFLSELLVLIKSCSCIHLEYKRMSAIISVGLLHRGPPAFI